MIRAVFLPGAKTPQLPAILKALLIAMDARPQIPLVYYTGGYEDPDTLRLLEGTMLLEINFSDEILKLSKQTVF